MNNIYPIFDLTLNRKAKESLLKQKAVVVWMIGLSGSGKSTLARYLENSLHTMGYYTQILDGDNLRTGINNNLGFSAEDRIENIRRTAETAKLFLNAGAITICSFITPTAKTRELAKSIIGEADYFEVFINCPLEVCENRDVKGLYAKARKGEIKNFTGIDAPFDAPENPDLELNTDINSIEGCHDTLVKRVLAKIKFEDNN
ncbi:MAG: adenylyl-sulfate kinase [Bacteroidota bacterium]|nr:adenylyl-sulfate kinase [Bacteroidota bacterium]